MIISSSYLSLNVVGLLNWHSIYHRFHLKSFKIRPSSSQSPCVRLIITRRLTKEILIDWNAILFIQTPLHSPHAQTHTHVTHFLSLSKDISTRKKYTQRQDNVKKGRKYNKIKQQIDHWDGQVSHSHSTRWKRDGDPSGIGTRERAHPW